MKPLIKVSEIQRDKTMADKFIYISNDDIEISLSVDYNVWMKNLNTQLNKPTNKKSIKGPKVVETNV